MIKWEDLISVFVDNLPEKTSATWLSWAFSCYGKVMDVFILTSSRRRDGKCFGLVRYRKEEWP